AEKTNTLRVQTPEGIVFSLPLAGPVTRCMAWVIDQLCIFGAMAVIIVAVVMLGVLIPDLSFALMFLAFFTIQIGYGIATEWFWRGQTVGKRVLRLRVVDAHGLKLQFSQIVIRNLLRFVDSLPALYLLGGIVCLASRKAQRLGDLAANTIVVRTPQAFEPNLEQLFGGKFNSLRQHPHLAARLRQRVSPAEAGVALRALVRRDDLEPAARVELFAEIAGHFRSLVEFPPDAVEGLADEQYVRNVVDIIYRQRGKEEARAGGELVGR
ncbi:MAG: RDD family protein, partial [Verrucomicrobiota bacterium]